MAGTGARSIAPSLAALEAGSKGSNLGQPPRRERSVWTAPVKGHLGAGATMGGATACDACGVLRPLCEARIWPVGCRVYPDSPTLDLRGLRWHTPIPQFT